MSSTNGGRSATIGADPGITRRLLWCGVVAGVVFTGLSLLQMTTREGFDLRRHPLSALSLGDWGWVQMLNFVLTGLLVVAGAAGMRRLPKRAGIWGPRLVAICGVGYVVAGGFRADPSDGFPPGTPSGIPDDVSWHAAIHGAAAIVAFLAITGACFVFARRRTSADQPAWRVYCWGTGTVALALSLWPDQDSASVRLALAAILTWLWLAALSTRLLPRKFDSDVDSAASRSTHK